VTDRSGAPGPNRDVDAIIDATPDERGVIMAKLRDVIHAADPEIVEVVKWRKPSSPLGAAVFEHDGIVCILIPLKGRVRISFVEGAFLPDPKRLFNAHQCDEGSDAFEAGSSDPNTSD